jgi:hypothetical protein
MIKSKKQKPITEVVTWISKIANSHHIIIGQLFFDDDVQSLGQNVN